MTAVHGRGGSMREVDVNSQKSFRAAKSRELAGAAALRLPAVNGELSAAVVWGSHLKVAGHPRTTDGVTGAMQGVKLASIECYRPRLAELGVS